MTDKVTESLEGSPTQIEEAGKQISEAAGFFFVPEPVFRVPSPPGLPLSTILEAEIGL